MSNFVVSARKYRPAKFNEVVGQQHVSNTLKNALQNDHLAHSFLFCGPRGVGKTTCARILAKTINCENPTDDHEACDTCNSCQAFDKNASFNITELDAASNNSVEHIRALIEQVRFQPQQGSYKVFIIDEVHMLSQAAFNAFLKTLEEPPSYAIFILATTEKHKIIPTILSRCQIFDFRRIQIPDMVAHLQDICQTEGIEAEKDALHIIAQKADGALRDALSIFDRMVSFNAQKITYNDVIENLNVLDYDYFFKIVDAMLTENISVVMNTFDEITRKGFDPDIFINGLAEHLRNLMVCKNEQTLQLLEVSDGLKGQYKTQASNAPTAFVLSALNVANECDVNYKMARNKRLHVEMAIIKMTYINRAIELVKQNEPAPAPVAIPNKTANFQMVEEPRSKAIGQSIPKATVPVAPTSKPEEPVKAPVKKNGLLNESSKLNVSSMFNAPKFSLDAIEADIANDDVAEEDSPTYLTLDTLKKVWMDFAQNIPSPSARNTLKNAILTLNDKEITATVGTRMAENIIKSEADLMAFMRKALKEKRLILRTTVDTSLATKKIEPEKNKKPMTNKEKYQKMIERNPMVEELRKRFDLKADKP